MGKKQNWLFLRGLSREVAHWEGFPERFEKYFSGTRAFALDLPGNGEFRQIPTPLSLDGLVDFVRLQWKQKAPAPFEPLNIFALSLGGMVALRWMQRYPDEIQSAVLVNTSLKGLSPFFHRLSPSAYWSILKIFISRNTRTREKTILRLTSQKKEWSQECLTERAAIQRKRPVSKSNAFRQILAAMSSFDSKKPPVQPVLLLNSLGDHLVHPDCSQSIAEAWQVPLRRHAWAGHDLTLDDPEWVLRAIEEWNPQFSKNLSKSK
jgi:pimeloyl-ACP methyl ester carboxylesterase